MLLSFQRVHGGTILFGNKGKSSIIGSGDVDLSEMIKIKEVNLVEDLQYNLLSVSQLCDQGINEVRFTTRDVKVVSPKGHILLKGKRVGSTYIFDYDFSLTLPVCLSAISAVSQLWHKRLGHASLYLLDKLHKKELVRGLPKVNVEDMSHCSACSRGKMTRSTFKSKKIVSTTVPLELIHMDLCGPMRTQSYGGNRYIFVLVDDFSRYTWTLFLKSKDQAFTAFSDLLLMLENRYQTRVRSLRSDNGLEFVNSQFIEFCCERGISHEFSSPHTPQQNGVVERKNRTLEDMARTMLIASKLPQRFWAQAVDTSMLYY